MKAVITVTCPCCKGTLDIDVAGQRVLSHKRYVDLESSEEAKDIVFEDVLKKVHNREDAAERAFESARREAAESEKKLDALFGDVKKKIEEQKDKEPEETDRRDLFWD